ncbi:MAG: xanthine dehydrogenase family protein molybdopterin-binding subunit [bacterium]
MTERIETRVVGERLPSVDGVEKVTGATGYIGDLQLPGALFGRALRSPHPHARILNVDTSEAERLPGVFAVLSRNNTPERRFGINDHDETAFCRDKARYVGDEVAAVAAADEETALEALARIRVEYEVLPMVGDPDAAMAEGAPLVHEGVPGNIANQFHITRGDVDAAFGAADATFAEDFQTHLAHQAYIEPTGCAAEWHAGGRITLWGCLQASFIIRTYMIAPVTGLDPDDIRVIATKPGGAFGGKLDVKAALLTAMLCQAAQKPVKFLLPLGEDLISMRPRMPIRIHLESAFRADGKLMGKRVRVLAENGAYSSLSPTIMSSVALRTDNLYRTPVVDIEGKLVYTNVCPSGQMRGFGNVQATFAWESHLDTAAAGLGIDPVALRLKNYVETGDVTLHGWKIASCGVADSARYAAEAIGWEENRPRGGKGRGVGLASTIHVTGNKGFAVALGPDDTEPSGSSVRIGPDGKIEIWTAESDLGQGSASVMAYIAAEELGLPVEDISVPPTDTGCMPFGFGAFASRITLIGGNSVKIAAGEARKALLRAAADVLEAAPEELVIEGREIAVQGLPERRVTVSEVVQKAGGLIEGSGVWLAGGEPLDNKKYGNPSTTYSFSTHAAEVEVDTETGIVTVLRLAAGHDPGRVINRMGAEGQVEGGAIQAMSYCLMEGLAPLEGHIRATNFHDYLIATSMDAPPVEHAFFETIDPHGPYGAKGLAETAINPTSAAIANAIFHATGARVRSLPITPERMLAAIDEARKPKSG